MFEEHPIKVGKYKNHKILYDGMMYYIKIKKMNFVIDINIEPYKSCLFQN